MAKCVLRLFFLSILLLLFWKSSLCTAFKSRKQRIFENERKRTIMFCSFTRNEQKSKILLIKYGSLGA